jgi:hypothetical protein
MRTRKLTARKEKMGAATNSAEIRSIGQRIP